MVTAESFWDTFSSELRSACLNDPRWKHDIDHAKDWTIFTKRALFSVGETLGFNRDNDIHAEFYKIDFIYYKRRDNPPKSFTIPSGEWVTNWDLEIAIEHENNYAHWLWDVAKLCHINCGLKVIIGYHHYGNEGKHGTIKQKLDFMKNVYDQIQYKQNPDNWLLLLGPNTYAECKGGNDFVAYKFDGKNFYLLEDKKVFRP